MPCSLAHSFKFISAHFSASYEQMFATTDRPLKKWRFIGEGGRGRSSSPPSVNLRPRAFRASPLWNFTPTGDGSRTRWAVRSLLRRLVRWSMLASSWRRFTRFSGGGGMDLPGLSCLRTVGLRLLDGSLCADIGRSAPGLCSSDARASASDRLHHARRQGPDISSTC